MELNRRNMLALTGALPVLASCGLLPRRQIVVLGEDLPGTRAIKKVAENVLGQKRVRFILDRYEDMVIKANTDLAAKTGSYDLILQYNAALANYVRNDYVVPLQEFSDKAWVEALPEHLFTKAWKEVGWYKRSPQEDEKPFGVPFSANSMLLCCNRALFEDEVNRSRFRQLTQRDLRPPATWDEFEEVARFFTTNTTRGVALHGAEYWNYYEWANLAYSNGGGVMKKEFGWKSDGNTPLILSSPQTIEATERYLRLKAYSQFGQPSADLFATDAAGQVQLMKTGRYAMAILWSDVAHGLVRSDMMWSDAYTFDVIPGAVSMLAGGSYYLNRKSRSRREAEKVIKDLFEPARQKELARLGLCPPRKEIYQDEELLKEVPYFRALGGSLERGVYMLEAGLDADPIMAAVSRTLQELFRSAQPPDVAAALMRTQDEISVARQKIFNGRRT